MAENQTVPPYWDWAFWWRHLVRRKPGYLHHFLRSDDDRALHDHPWHFLSIILTGGYWEHRQGRPITFRSYRPSGSIAFRKAGTLHRVELERDRDEGWRYTEKPCWTLIVTGPKVREWGFLCKKAWVHWQQFDSQNGCGEFA